MPMLDFDAEVYGRKEREFRPLVFKWAAKNAGVPVTDLEICEEGTGLKLRDGRVIARRNPSKTINASWSMVGFTAPDLVFLF